MYPITELPWSKGRPEVVVNGIYRIRLKDDPKCRCYIGSSCDIWDRWVRHKKDLRNGKHHAIKLQRAWNKYGEDAFIFEVVEVCWVTESMQWEQQWLDIYGEKRLFNSSMFAGSLRGYEHTPETRAKMSAAKMGNPSNLGKKLTAEHKANISATSPLKARTHCPKDHPYDEENTYYYPDGSRGCKACNRETLREYRATPEGAAAQKASADRYYERKRQEKIEAGTFGKRPPITEEAKVNMSIAQQKSWAGRTHTPEARARISEAAKRRKGSPGHQHSEETKAKIIQRRLNPISEEEVLEIRQLRSDGHRVKDLAIKFDVSLTTIYAILNETGKYKVCQ